jgi:cephalosporin hydroxylase
MDLLAHADALFERGDVVGALRQYRSVLETDPGMAGLNGRLAKCFSRLARFDLALSHAEQELKIDPGNLEIRELHRQIKTILQPAFSVADPNSPEAWKTSIPRDFLLTLQAALHRFQYRGVPMLKNPFDLAIYLQLLWKLRPKSIFEIGSHSGGSALWMADLMKSFGAETAIFSVDIVRVLDVTHPFITFFEGDAANLSTVFPKSLLRQSLHPWLVIDDASHQFETSKEIVDFFNPFMEVGDYFVIEDGIISDLFPESYPGATSGPHMAVRYVLEAFPNRYVIDRQYCDLFGYNVTWCTNGFLQTTGSL